MRELTTVAGRPDITVGKEWKVHVPVSEGVYRRVRGTITRIVETADFAVVVMQSDNGSTNLVKVL